MATKPSEKAIAAKYEKKESKSFQKAEGKKESPMKQIKADKAIMSQKEKGSPVSGKKPSPVKQISVGKTHLTTKPVGKINQKHLPPTKMKKC